MEDLSFFKTPYCSTLWSYFFNTNVISYLRIFTVYTEEKKNTLHQNKPFSWKKTRSCDIWSQNTKFDIRIIWYFLAWPNVSYYCSRMLSPFNRTHWIAILSKLNVVLWERVLEQVKKKSYLTETLVRGFDKTWGDRQVLCRRHDLHITWNWKRQRS